MSATASELVDKRNLNRYKKWRAGHLARLEGKTCAENNGDYLDGYYSPDAIIPDFLTHKEAARLRRQM
jgi:hypothetical protein